MRYSEYSVCSTEQVQWGKGHCDATQLNDCRAASDLKSNAIEGNFKVPGRVPAPSVHMCECAYVRVWVCECVLKHFKGKQRLL